MAKNNSLEIEFSQLVKKFGPGIQEKLDQALFLVKEAKAIADAEGLPFYSPLCDLPQTYIPKSARKFKGLSRETLESAFNGEVIPGDFHFANGWMHSQVGC